MVLPAPKKGLSACAASDNVQVPPSGLQQRLQQLENCVVRAEEGVLLRARGQRLPHVCPTPDNVQVPPGGLQQRLQQLEDCVVRAEEGVLLRARGQRLPHVKVSSTSGNRRRCPPKVVLAAWRISQHGITPLAWTCGRERFGSCDAGLVLEFSITKA